MNPQDNWDDVNTPRDKKLLKSHYNFINFFASTILLGAFICVVLTIIYYIDPTMFGDNDDHSFHVIVVYYFQGGFFSGAFVYFLIAFLLETNKTKRNGSGFIIIAIFFLLSLIFSFICAVLGAKAQNSLLIGTFIVTCFGTFGCFLLDAFLTKYFFIFSAFFSIVDTIAY